MNPTLFLSSFPPTNRIKNTEISIYYPNIPLHEIMETINALLESGHIVLVKEQGGGITYVKRDEEEMKRRIGLTEEETIIYDIVANSGNKGIWVQDLSRAANLHKQVTSKIVTKLMNKNSFKQVKVVKSSKRVIMLYDIQPAPELLGGVWHTEQDLDQDFVNTMSMAAMYQLRKLTLAKPGEIYAGQPATPLKILEYLLSINITSAELTEMDISELLEMLVIDGKIERRIDTHGMGYVCLPSDEFSASLQKLTQAPCGKCPIAKWCTPGGIVGPENCKYYLEWLER